MMVRELKYLEKYEEVNQFLKVNGWFFVCPFFLTGGELSYLGDLSKAGSDQRENISNLIARKFYQLESTASFVDGYCRRSFYIEPFLLSIEHSIVLTLQRDYEGAIKTLIPIFEGILRRYLIHDHDRENKDIRFSDLKRCFNRLKLELIEGAEAKYRTEHNENGQPLNLSANQIKNLVQYETQYLDKWFSFITGFVEESLYLNTQNMEITDELSRHAILHEFGLGTDYSLENYLKVYMSIEFLTWIFLKKDGKSLLCEAGGFRFLEKVTAYEEIIRSVDRLSYAKHTLYSPYTGYVSEQLRNKMPFKSPELLPNP